jgi:hypothetical protein
MVSVAYWPARRQGEDLLISFEIADAPLLYSPIRSLAIRWRMSQMGRSNFLSRTEDHRDCPKGESERQPRSAPLSGRRRGRSPSRPLGPCEPISNASRSRRRRRVAGFHRTQPAQAARNKAEGGFYSAPITSPSMSCFCVMGFSSSTTRQTKCSRSEAGRASQ